MLINKQALSQLKNKIIIVLGPTASGKSDLAVRLAKKFNGEVISADSRQVYKGMNIGTGKITKKEMLGIPHHLLDIASPKTKFDVVKYKKLANKAIENIFKKGKLPIVCGGTGFYIQAIVDNVIFPEVKANPELRKKLEKQPIEKLLQTLKKLDIARFKTVDQENKRRIIRAIEISKAIGKVPKLKSDPKYNALQIGIGIDKETLKKNIEKRLGKRLRQGMIAEVKKLHNPPVGGGVSWKKLIEFGLEYRFVALYLQGKITKQELANQLESAIWQYAKRQITWFKRDKRINWIKNQKTAENLIKKFLK